MIERGKRREEAISFDWKESRNCSWQAGEHITLLLFLFLFYGDGIFIYPLLFYFILFVTSWKWNGRTDVMTWHKTTSSVAESEGESLLQSCQSSLSYLFILLFKSFNFFEYTPSLSNYTFNGFCLNSHHLLHHSPPLLHFILLYTTKIFCY